MPDVCIISMPYELLYMPSVGIGQLVAAAKGRGIDARAVYTKFWFAEKIGTKNYNFICGFLNPASLLAEWTFSKAAFPGFQAGDDEYLAMAISSYHEEIFIANIVKHHSEYAGIAELLQDTREKAGDFINEAAARILDMNPRIVGCSSMFQQHCASLALLRKLKELNPEIVTVMGGANCEGIMGQTVLKCFPWVDFVMSGEADLAFPVFCEQVLAGGTAVNQDKLPYGMISREYVNKTQDNDITSPVAMVDDLDNVPVPDYADYFEELGKYSARDDINPALMFETSRGCWWGQKQKCSFCGLNGNNVRFRRKSTDRIMDEIDALSHKYSLHRFFASDSIMDMNHFKDLLPRLSANGPGKNIFFFETKSNLNEQQVMQLRQAGVTRIQPGIESLNDNALKLMNKGNSAAGNVALLKYAMENGVTIRWNYLTGMPGEDDAWNDETAQWLPLIYHFEPPGSIGSIRFDRFSSYYNHQDRYGLKLTPHKTYACIYPVGSSEIENMAYYFEDYMQQGRGAGPGAKRLNNCIKEWIKAFYGSCNPDQAGSSLQSADKKDARPQLIMREMENMTVITDTRDCALQREYFLEGLEHQIHQFCRQPRPVDRLPESFNRHYGLTIEPPELDKVINKLREWKLVVILGGRVLSLATRETKYNKNRAENKSALSFAWLKDL